MPYLEPAEETAAALISGVEAYQRYAEHTMPFLIENGGEVILAGEAGQSRGSRSSHRCPRGLAPATDGHR